ncbi:hypothetical protein [Streptomyces sp. NBC_01367]|uniref:hypothetical protein n=1 Tax=Streptomyces sp. NBC_01367 TaxID=2903841 RepID=UPI00324BE0B2
MAGREDHLAYPEIVLAALDGDWQEYQGGPFDVRAVMASLPQRAKDAYAYDQVPWERFSSGPVVRADLEQLRNDDAETARHALRGLWGVLANSSRSACALTVPFLLRIGADARAHFRVDVLGMAAKIARQTTGPGLCTRAELLRVAYADNEWTFEPSGYPGHWSIQAAREAITADADLVIALLADPDPNVRVAAAYTLVSASGRADDIRGALHARLSVEEDPAARAGLVLAIAQVAREHGDTDGERWTRMLWSDIEAPPEMRVSAGLGWLCLTDAAVPSELRAVVDECASAATAQLMGPLPWMRAVEYEGDAGLQRCIRTLIHLQPDAPDRDGPPC